MEGKNRKERFLVCLAVFLCVIIVSLCWFESRLVIGWRPFANIGEEGLYYASFRRAFEEDITLKPNQILTYSSYEGKATVKATDAAESYKWYEEYLTFDNSRFSDILQNISKRYNIEVKTMTSTSMMDKRMSLTITSENLQAAMELITMLLPIRYEIIGNTLIIRDKYPNNN